MKSTQTLKTLTTSVALATLFGCAAQQPIAQQPSSTTLSLPGWVMNPVVENGMADTQCVLAKPTMSTRDLKSQAITLARAELSKQIKIFAKQMDKAYQRLADTTQGQEQAQKMGGTFASVSEQVSEQVVKSSQVIHEDYVTMPGGEQNFCLMAAISHETMKPIFRQLAKKSSANLSLKDADVLYEQLTVRQSDKDIDLELELE